MYSFVRDSMTLASNICHALSHACLRSSLSFYVSLLAMHALIETCATHGSLVHMRLCLSLLPILCEGFASLCMSWCRSLVVLALVFRFGSFYSHGVPCVRMRWNQRTDTYSDARHQQNNCCEQKMGGSGALGGCLVHVPCGTHAHKDYADVRGGFSKRRRAIPCFAGGVSTPFRIKWRTCWPDGGGGGGGGVGSYMQRLLVISLSYLSFYSPSSTCLLSGQRRTLRRTRLYTSGQANGVVEGTRLSFAASSTCGGTCRHSTHVRTSDSLPYFNITT